MGGESGERVGDRPGRAGSAAQAELCAQLVRSGLVESRARDACDALAACAARLAHELRAAAAAEAEVSVSRELPPRAAAAAQAAGSP